MFHVEIEWVKRAILRVSREAFEPFSFLLVDSVPRRTEQYVLLNLHTGVSPYES